nr:rRNA 2'-O-methyltransferase fibrillarin-like [Aegilops tauschii subsp. strangulata]
MDEQGRPKPRPRVLVGAACGLREAERGAGRPAGSGRPGQGRGALRPAAARDGVGAGRVDSGVVGSGWGWEAGRGGVGWTAAPRGGAERVGVEAGRGEVRGGARAAPAGGGRRTVRGRGGEWMRLRVWERTSGGGVAASG